MIALLLSMTLAASPRPTVLNEDERAEAPVATLTPTELVLERDRLADPPSPALGIGLAVPGGAAFVGGIALSAYASTIAHQPGLFGDLDKVLYTGMGIIGMVVGVALLIPGVIVGVRRSTQAREWGARLRLIDDRLLAGDAAPLDGHEALMLQQTRPPRIAMPIVSMVVGAALAGFGGINIAYDNNALYGSLGLSITCIAAGLIAMGAGGIMLALRLNDAEEGEHAAPVARMQTRPRPEQQLPALPTAISYRWAF